MKNNLYEDALRLFIKVSNWKELGISLVQNYPDIFCELVAMDTISKLTVLTIYQKEGKYDNINRECGLDYHICENIFKTIVKNSKEIKEI